MLGEPDAGWVMGKGNIIGGGGSSFTAFVHQLRNFHDVVVVDSTYHIEYHPVDELFIRNTIQLNEPV